MDFDSLKELQEELDTVTTQYDDPGQQIIAQSSILSDMGFWHWEHGNQTQAWKLWHQSHELFPYWHERNTIASLLAISEKDFATAEFFVKTYMNNFVFEQCQGEYSERHNSTFIFDEDDLVNIAKKLDEPFKNNAIDQYPWLLTAYYHAVRNNEDIWGLNLDNLDFYNQYAQKLIADAEQHKHPFLMTIIGNMYLIDVKDKSKALQYYKKSFDYSEGNVYTIIDRFCKCSFEQNETPWPHLNALRPKLEQADPGCLYSIRCELSEFREYAEENDIDCILDCLDLEIFVSEKAHTKMKSYIIEGDLSNPFYNKPHLFAMNCNNYGISLSEFYYEKNNCYDTNIEKICANIHIMGYGVSPFAENIISATRRFYGAKFYSECLKYGRLLEQEYIDSVSPGLMYLVYHHMVVSAIETKVALPEIEKIYYRSQTYFLDHHDTEDDVDADFITAIRTYCKFLLEELDYERLEKEADWVIENNIAEEFTYSEGILYFYLGIAKENNKKTSEAIIAYQKAIDLLDDFEDDEAEEAVSEAKANIIYIQNDGKNSFWAKLKRLFRT